MKEAEWSETLTQENREADSQADRSGDLVIHGFLVPGSWFLVLASPKTDLPLDC